MMHRISNSLSLISAVFFATTSLAQSTRQITIDSCYTWAENNYPLIQQLDILNKTGEYTIDNASKGYLPQIVINGQASYQSAVTSLPFSLPNMRNPLISKDQYRIFADINQPLTTAFTIPEQKDFIKSGIEIESKKIEIELFKLKDQINNLYFGLLLLDVQIDQINVLQKDIKALIEKAEAGVKNGTAIKSNENLLRAEYLKSEQKKTEILASREAYLSMLQVYTGKIFDTNTILIKPADKLAIPTINRLEVQLFDLQNHQIGIQSKLLNTKRLPQASFFLQGGYGRPTLNMLNNDFNFYYLGGFRVNWNISNFYTFKKDHQLLDLTEQSISIQKKVFLHNTEIQLSQQNTEVTKYEQLIKSDNELLDLRISLKNTASNQLENGVISTLDFISYLNAEDQTRLDLRVHEIKLLMAKTKLNNTSGNN